MWYNAPWNAETIKFIQSSSSLVLDILFQLFTMFGEEYFFIFALTGIYWCIDKKLGYRMGFAFLSGVALNTGIKESFMIPRPIGEPGIRTLREQTATGWSFPSGHTQGAATFWTSAMTNFKGRSLKHLGIIIMILVGISRLYLGVHRPIDVIVGMVLGIVWVYIVNRMFNYMERGGSKWVIGLVIIPGLIVMIFLRNSDYYKAMGTVLGFLAGYIIEPVYIGYEEKGTVQQNIMKLVIGFAGLLAIKLWFKLILPDGLLSELIRYFLIGAWVTLGATYIFKKGFSQKRYLLG